jgi:hypothetical protein
VRCFVRRDFMRNRDFWVSIFRCWDCDYCDEAISVGAPLYLL